jgi:hypothetical protein
LTAPGHDKSSRAHLSFYAVATHISLAPCFSRLLKNDFSTTFSCKNPNDFEGQFFKTWLFQHSAVSRVPINRSSGSDITTPANTQLKQGVNKRAVNTGTFNGAPPPQKLRCALLLHKHAL